jgi:16S rRNA (guanine527-N7)-methyltransferase
VSARERIEALAAEYELAPGSAARIERILDLLAHEPASITSVRDPAKAVDIHVADSLAALRVGALRGAGTIADLGSGGGFPGLALALALPHAHVALVESNARKCAFLERAIAATALENAEVVNARAEEWEAGRGANDVVTARALAPLPTVVEYAAPLLRDGGALVAWKGAPEPSEEADGVHAAAVLGLEHAAIFDSHPFPGSRDHRLYLYLKVRSTPNGYPRRPGMARKRPLRASTSD